MKTPHELFKELAGTKCRCGKKKNVRQSFCSGCYYSLPVAMRKELYQRIGEGYEEAYAAAVERLDGATA